MSENQEHNKTEVASTDGEITINATRASDFLKSLDERPKEQMAFVYQAIIVSLIAHIFILFVTQMLTQDHRVAEDEVVYEELAMDMLPDEPLPEEPEPQEQMQRSGELKNLVANENSERSSDARSYRGMSSSQMKEQVYNDLKNMEAEEFAKLKGGEPDYTVANKSQGQGTSSSEPKKSDMDWYREQKQNKSYSGPVTASFNMAGRDPLENPIPTYRCKTNGTVVVNVSIDELGKVIDARINESASSLNECLRGESEKYARKWRFDYSSRSRKQDGTITFTFSAQ
ncbi:MAG: TonB family protein [Flavobacteriales bacterium]|jgi:TonB family protein